MPHYKQTQKDLEERLKEQHKFLMNSCEAYDEGDVAESKRIALHLRILLHDTGLSKSLLNLLGSKNIKFLDTAGKITRKEPTATCNFVNLTFELFSGKSEIVPAFDKHVVLEWMDFEEWWDKVIYFDPANGNILTRKLLILTVSNKDGGAHIDPEIDNKTYVDLTKNNAFGWKATINNTPIDTSKALYAMIRQIAFEVMHTIEQTLLPIK